MWGLLRSGWRASRGVERGWLSRCRFIYRCVSVAHTVPDRVGNYIYIYMSGIWPAGDAFRAGQQVIRKITLKFVSSHVTRARLSIFTNPYAHAQKAKVCKRDNRAVGGYDEVMTATKFPVIQDRVAVCVAIERAQQTSIDFGSWAWAWAWDYYSSAPMILSSSLGCGVEVE